MEIFGTSFNLTLGSWRLRLGIALEDVDAPGAPATRKHPHRVRIVPEDDFLRHEAAN